MIILRSVLLRKRNVSEKVVQKIRKHSLYPTTSLKNRVVYETTWKNIVAGQAIDDNIAHAHCMLYN